MFDLGKLSENFGKLRVVGILSKVSLGTIVNGFCGFAYLFFGMDAIIRLSKGNLERKAKVIAWLDLANAITQVAIMILFFASGPLLGVLGLSLLSGVISVITFGYRCRGGIKKIKHG